MSHPMPAAPPSVTLSLSLSNGSGVPKGRVGYKWVRISGLSHR